MSKTNTDLTNAILTYNEQMRNVTINQQKELFLPQHNVELKDEQYER